MTILFLQLERDDAPPLVLRCTLGERARAATRAARAWRPEPVGRNGARRCRSTQRAAGEDQACGGRGCLDIPNGWRRNPGHPGQAARAHRMRDGSVPMSINGRTEARGKAEVGAGTGDSRPRMQSAATVCAPMDKMPHHRRV